MKQTSASALMVFLIAIVGLVILDDVTREEDMTNDTYSETIVDETSKLESNNQFVLTDEDIED